MGAPVKGPLLVSDPEIAEILKKVYQSQRRTVFPSLATYRYKASYAHCWTCDGKAIPLEDREVHEMWHALKEAP